MMVDWPEKNCSIMFDFVQYSELAVFVEWTVIQLIVAVKSVTKQWLCYSTCMTRIRVE